jgi:hypothetical protein
MRKILPILLILSACGAPAPEEAGNDTADIPVPSGPPILQQAEGEVPDAAVEGVPRWESATGDGGTGIRLVDEGGVTEMSIFCPQARTRLVVSVPKFKAIGSEERFSLALGDEPVTLVADPTRQKQGVTGEGAVPDNFSELLKKAERIGARYGNQQTGPHALPPKPLREALSRECGT